MSSAQAVSSFEAELSNHDLNMDEVETEDLKLVESQGDRQIVEVDEEVSSVSDPGEGILLMNPRLKVMGDDLGKVIFLYTIPNSMEIHTSKAYKRVYWVVPG